MLYWLQFDNKQLFTSLNKASFIITSLLFSDLVTFKSLHRPFNLILSDNTLTRYVHRHYSLHIITHYSCPTFKYLVMDLDF